MLVNECTNIVCVYLYTIGREKSRVRVFCYLLFEGFLYRLYTLKPHGYRSTWAKRFLSKFAKLRDRVVNISRATLDTIEYTSASFRADYTFYPTNSLVLDQERSVSLIKGVIDGE